MTDPSLQVKEMLANPEAFAAAAAAAAAAPAASSAPAAAAADEPAKKDRKSTRLNSSHSGESRMPSSA